MSIDIVCPECGGIIGGTSTGGRPACSCVHESMPSKSDTVRIEMPLPDLNERQQKVCISCGKDVTGHRRVKDSRGYMCLACAKAEMAAEKAGKIRCAECRKYVRAQGLVDYDGIKICRSCFNAHKELKKKAVKKVATRHYELHEKRTLMWLAIVGAVLLLLIISGWLFS